MERKGGCCIAPRYGAAAGGQQAAGASWQMGRIMLKFRPIAPKPAAMEPVPTPAPAPVPAAGRVKRKATGGGGGRRGRKPKRAATVAAVAAAPAVQAAGDGTKKDCGDKEKSLSSRSSSSSGMTSVDSPPSPPTQQQPATLPLMPISQPLVEDKAAPLVAAPAAGAQPAPRPAAASAAVAPASWVTVEEVTATWRDAEEAPGPARADGDDAPAFVSDQWGRVTWTNAAFARAVSADGEVGGDEAAARAVGLAGELPAWGTCAGFTCRVRVVTPARRAGGSSVVAPCDVWRLDAGGCYLWRLDLQAALTLGGLP